MLPNLQGILRKQVFIARQIELIPLSIRGAPFSASSASFCKIEQEEDKGGVGNQLMSEGAIPTLPR